MSCRFIATHRWTSDRKNYGNFMHAGQSSISIRQDFFCAMDFPPQNEVVKVLQCTCFRTTQCLIALLTALCLSGCNQGDEQTAVPAAAASPPSTSAVQSIVLRGAPPTSVLAGTQYSFTPTVVGSTTRVMFSMAGQPAWARFDSNTDGTPGGKSGRIPGPLRDESRAKRSNSPALYLIFGSRPPHPARGTVS